MKDDPFSPPFDFVVRSMPCCFNNRTVQICKLFFFFPLIRVAIAVVSRCSHSLVLLEELVDGPSLCVDALVRDAVLVEHAPLGVKGHFPRLHSRDCVPHSHGISV